MRADDWSLVERYRFGTRTCDFLICRRCGVFIAAVAEMKKGARAVVNVNCLDDRERFTSAPTMHEFQGETIDRRLSRRAANWMPAVLRQSLKGFSGLVDACRALERRYDEQEAEARATPRHQGRHHAAVRPPDGAGLV